jgi:Ca-activated chloride channel family protein
VVFGNDAWQVSLKDLPYLQVGPFHTNTVAGLELAMDILRRRKLKNRRIVMITDGKPSCIKRDGEYYMNSFGLDDFIVARTLDAAVRAEGGHSDHHVHDRAGQLPAALHREIHRSANQGRAFYTGLQGLADMVFRDHASNRKASN